MESTTLILINSIQSIHSTYEKTPTTKKFNHALIALLKNNIYLLIHCIETTITIFIFLYFYRIVFVRQTKRKKVRSFQFSKISIDQFRKIVVQTPIKLKYIIKVLKIDINDNNTVLAKYIQGTREM